MNSFEPHPPTTHHSSIPLSPNRALSLLSAYLTSALIDPSLHPNALLTETGPIAQSVGANTGLVLHNLTRVEAGLRGENLGADLTFKKFGGEELPDLMVDDAPRSGLANGNKEGSGKLDGREDGEGMWQDKEEFEREQEVVQGEIGPRGNGVEGEAGEVPSVRRSGDKEERKRRKKERRKALQKELQRKKKREEESED